MTKILAPRSRRLVMVGRLARIRPSSVILVPSSGVFRSARSSTVLPSTSRSSIPRTAPPSAAAGQPGAHQGGQVGEPVGVAPLVVVPADDLDLIALRHREQRVERAGPWG